MSRREPFDEVLQECILRMKSGEDVESVLASYQDRARELRPHLRVLASLSSLEEQGPSSQGMARGRQQLMGALSAPVAVNGGIRTMFSLGGSTGRYLAFFFGGAVAALAIAFLAGSLDTGSSSNTAQAGAIQQCVLVLDFNHDGMLGVQDVAAFKTAIQNQDLTFDFNKDGKVDIFDVVYTVQQISNCIQQIQPPPVPTPPPTP